MDKDISDINLEQLISNAKQGNKASLGILMDRPEMRSLLNEVSTQVARGEFKFNAILIREELFDKLCLNMQSIENSSLDGLKAWAYATAKNYCRSRHRHNRVVTRYNEQVINEQTSGKRKSANGAILLPNPANNSPENILLKKEAVTFLNSLCLQVVNIIETFSPEDRRIVILWGQGNTLKETYESTGIPLSTVGKHLKKRQKQIIERIGLSKLVDGDPKLLKVVYEVIANTIQDRGNFETFPPKAA